MSTLRSVPSRRKSDVSRPHSVAGVPSERAFRLLVDNVTDYAIFLLTPEGNIASWNPGAKRIKQYKAAEIIGKHFSIFYPKVDIENGKPEMELRAAAQTGRFEDEGWRLRKDGSPFWASVIITALRNEGGELLGFGKITRDISDRREAELRYRLLIEAVTDYAIFSLDKNGNVTSWNSGAERIKGYSAGEIIGKHFSQFYTKNDAEAGLPLRVLETAATQGHFAGEGWRIRKDGSKFWSNVVVTALRDEDGELIGFSKITRDMTEKKKLLDTIQKHAEELELRIAERDQTNAELEAFSYSVSHDLRAPLRAIQGFTNIVLEDSGDQLPGDAKENLRQVLTAVRRMNRLVEDLLTYSRIGTMDLQLSRMSVSAALAEALNQLDPDHRGKVTTSVPSGLYINAHPATISQVFFNLIQNGLKFYPEGKIAHVEVSAEREGRNVVVAIRDEGIGIATQHQERIFKVFERLHTSNKYPGTGIGLAIVKRGVSRMGGTVRLKSEVGRGSAFYISLPTA